MKKGLVSLEVVNFRQEIERIETEFKDLANKEIEVLINYGTEQLKIVTPVDTGEARLGWENEIDRNKIGGFTGGAIINDVEHVSTLNNGHSQQAPKYFIEQVLTTIGLITPD